MSQLALRQPEPRAGALGAVVLLAGGLAPSPLARATGRSVLDLHLSATRTVMGRWAEAIGEVGGVSGAIDPVVLHSPDVPKPAETASVGFVVRTDLSAYRGPAGAVRDACAAVRGDDLVLVIEAGRYHGPSLRAIVSRQAADGADIVIAANADHTPAGVYLVRREVLDLVPPVGYLDLKEQLLGKALASGFRVSLEEYASNDSFPIRTRLDLLRAAEVESHRGDHGWEPDLTLRPTVVAQQNWASVVAAGARVADDAVLVESVVMPGATVGAGAVVVRSVLCEGAEVRAGASCVDRVVGPSGPLTDAQAAVPWSARRRRG